ncbi:Sister chromatid cohesion 1 protein 1, partial [Linum perenne]
RRATMFYSHQLLARKAPLGQIWMAATMQGKLNRKNLSKINIISICDEILNPSVPMALRLSGILMGDISDSSLCARFFGGVVIVYERKVKLFSDDVERLKNEINGAWKVESPVDRTLLAGRKLYAKKEAVTLPEIQDQDLPDIEQSANFSYSNDNMTFQNTSGYFAVQLDDVDEACFNNDAMEEDAANNLHQADPENITLCERFDACRVNTDIYDRFERFDVDGDGDTHVNMSFGEQEDIATILKPSPPPPPSPPHHRDDAEGGLLEDGQFFYLFVVYVLNVYNNLDDPFTATEIPDQNIENDVNQQPQEDKEERQSVVESRFLLNFIKLQHNIDQRVDNDDLQAQGAIRRKRKRKAGDVMDTEKTVIPGDLYQSWLQNPSDISSRRGRMKKVQSSVSFTVQHGITIAVVKCTTCVQGSRSILSSMKVHALMELPPMVIMDKLSIAPNRDIYYPEPLLALWTKCTKPPHDSPPVRTSSPPSATMSHSSPRETAPFPDQHNEDIPSRAGSQSVGSPRERQRTAAHIGNMEHLIRKVLEPNNLPSGDEFDNNYNNNIGMRMKEAVFTTPGNSGDAGINAPSSSSGHIPSHHSDMNSGPRTGSTLPFVPEETTWIPDDEMMPLHEDPELVVETGPTQTQPATKPQQLDPMTETIRMHLKDHFQAAGAPPFESLNNLAAGMNRKGAAMLFHQVCVLATRGCVKVDQQEPYGEIRISNGSAM